MKSNEVNNAMSFSIDMYKSPLCEITEIEIEGAILQNSFEKPNDLGGYNWDN